MLCTSGFEDDVTLPHSVLYVHCASYVDPFLQATTEHDLRDSSGDSMLGPGVPQAPQILPRPPKFFQGKLGLTFPVFHMFDIIGSIVISLAVVASQMMRGQAPK